MSHVCIYLSYEMFIIVYKKKKGSKETKEKGSKEIKEKGKQK